MVYTPPATNVTNINDYTRISAKAYKSTNTAPSETNLVKLALNAFLGFDGDYGSAVDKSTGTTYGGISASPVNSEGIQIASDYIATQGGVIKTEFVSGTDPNTSNSRYIVLPNNKGMGSNSVVSLNKVENDSAAIFSADFQFTPYDAASNKTLVALDDTGRSVVLDYNGSLSNRSPLGPLASGSIEDGYSYWDAFKMANSYEAADTGDLSTNWNTFNPLKMSEGTHNNDLTCEYKYVRDSNNQLTQDGLYTDVNGAVHVSSILDSTSTSQYWTLDLVGDMPTTNVSYFITQATGYDVVATDSSDRPVTNSTEYYANDADLSALAVRLGVHNTTAETFDLNPFVNKDNMDNNEYQKILGPYVATALTYTIQSTSQGEGGYSIPDNDGIITEVNDTNVVDNYALFDYVMADDVVHEIKITNGDLTIPEDTNSDQFTVSNGQETLTSSQWISDPYVRFLYSSMSNSSSSDTGVERAIVSNVSSGADKLDTVQVAYAGDAETSLNGTISSTVQAAESVSYIVTSLLASTGYDSTTGTGAAVSNWANGSSLLSNNAVLQKIGSDGNDALALGSTGPDDYSSGGDYTFNATGYTFPTDKVTIGDIAMGKVWQDEAHMYLYEDGSTTNLPYLTSTINIANADATIIDKKDLQMVMKPKPVSVFQNAFAADGWYLAEVAALDDANNLNSYGVAATDPHFESIFGSYLSDFMNSTHDVTINVKIEMNADASVPEAHYPKMTITSTTGSLETTSVVNNDEFVIADIIAKHLHSGPTNVTSDFSNVPTGYRIDEYVLSHKFTISTPFRLGTITNLNIVSPAITKTVTYYRVYSTTEGKYLPFTALTASYGGQRIQKNGVNAKVSEATLSTVDTLDKTFTIAAADVALRLMPYYIVFKQGNNVDDFSVLSTDAPTSANSVDPYTYSSATVPITWNSSTVSSTVHATVTVSSYEKIPYYNPGKLFTQELRLKADFSQFIVTLKEIALTDSIFGAGDFNIRTSAMPNTGTNLSSGTTISVAASLASGNGQQSTYTMVVTAPGGRGSITITCNTNPTNNLRFFAIPAGLYKVVRTLDGGEPDTPIYTQELGTAPNMYIPIDQGVYVATDSGAANSQGATATYTLLNNKVEVRLYDGYAGLYYTAGRITTGDQTTDSTISRNVTFLNYRGYNGTITTGNYNETTLTRTQTGVEFKIWSETKNTYVNQTWDLYNQTYTVDDLSNLSAYSSITNYNDLQLQFTSGVSMLSAEDYPSGYYTKYITTTADTLQIQISAPTNNLAKAMPNQGTNDYNAKSIATYANKSSIYEPVDNAANSIGYTFILVPRLKFNSWFYYRVTASSGGINIYKYTSEDIATKTTVVPDENTYNIMDNPTVGYLSDDDVTAGAYFGSGGVTTNPNDADSTKREWKLKKYISSGSFKAFFAVKDAQMKIEWQKSTSISAVPFSTPNGVIGVDKDAYWVDLTDSIIDDAYFTHDIAVQSATLATLFSFPHKTRKAFFLEQNTTAYSFPVPANRMKVDVFYGTSSTSDFAYHKYAANDTLLTAGNAQYDHGFELTGQPGTTIFENTRIKIARGSGDSRNKFTFYIDGAVSASGTLQTATDELTSQTDDRSVQISIGNHFIPQNYGLSLHVSAGDSVKTTLYVVDSIVPYADANTNSTNANKLAVRVARYTSGYGQNVSSWNNDTPVYWSPYAATKDLATFTITGINVLSAGADFKTLFRNMIAGVSTITWVGQSWSMSTTGLTLSYTSLLGSEKMNVLFNMTPETPIKVITIDTFDRERHEDRFGVPLYRVTQAGHVLTRNITTDVVNLRPTTNYYTNAVGGSAGSNGTYVWTPNTIADYFGTSVMNVTGQTL